MAQRVTVEVDWTSKSGAADATIAFGETFDLQISGIPATINGKIRMALLSQSVSSDDAVLWMKETGFVGYIPEPDTEPESPSTPAGHTYTPLPEDASADEVTQEEFDALHNNVEALAEQVSGLKYDFEKRIGTLESQFEVHAGADNSNSIIIRGIRFYTQKVYDSLKAQGGKAKLYLSVLNVRGEETVTDDDGETHQVAITTDYGIARITLTLGSYLENGPIPEDFEPDTMSIAELQNFLTQVKFDTQFYRNEAEQFKNSALSYSNIASNFSTSAASSAGHASTFATEAAASAKSAQSILTETTAVAATVTSQATAVAADKEAVAGLKSATDSNAAATSADALTSAEAAKKAVTAEANAKASADAAEAAKTETEQLLNTKQDKLIAGENITIAADGKTISATVPDITVDDALSTSSTNPVQNKVITNSLNQKVGWDLLTSYVRAEDSPDVEEAFGSEYRATDTAAFMSQRWYDGKFRGLALKDGVLKWIDNSGTVHTESLGGGGGGGESCNTEVWNGTIDSIDGVTDDMIGAKPLSNGNYPRLHARDKEIHGCKGFSNETGDYTGQELLLPWEVAMTNESSYLMAGVKFQADRGFGTQTFVQPLVPKETAAASAYFPYALPAFEDSPVYWKGHFIYANARQIFLPWDKIASWDQGTLALTSDIPDTSGFLTNSGTEDIPKLSGKAGVTITTNGANGIGIYTNNAGKMNGFILNPNNLWLFVDGVPQVLQFQTVCDSLKYGATANNNCCFTPKSNADDSLAFTIDRTKTLYTANITTDALETTLSVSDTKNVIADGEVCVIWLHIKVAGDITTAPQIAVPGTIQFLDSGPSFAVGSECMLALMSTDQGATWQANVQWEKAVTA